jgi:hypothetical protein
VATLGLAQGRPNQDFLEPGLRRDTAEPTAPEIHALWINPSLLRECTDGLAGTLEGRDDLAGVLLGPARAIE